MCGVGSFSRQERPDRCRTINGAISKHAWTRNGAPRSTRAFSARSPQIPLAEIRQAVGQTRVELAAKLGQGQASISKIEHAADLYLTTLRKYIEALGGELLLKATFPRGREIIIDQPSDLDAA